MIPWRIQLDVTFELVAAAPIDWSAPEVLAAVVRGLDLSTARPVAVSPRLVARSELPLETVGESTVFVGVNLETCT